MKVNFLSDLHLDLQVIHPDILNIKGDVCILAGDITEAFDLVSHRTDSYAKKTQGRFDKVFDALCKNFSEVLYIGGNHEHYRSAYTSTHSIIRDYLSVRGFNNVTVMENHTKTVGDVTFLAATLWTDFNKRNPLSMMMCRDGMNDFRRIYTDARKTLITPEMIADHHDYSRRWLEGMLTMTPGRRVVITHHAPSRQAETSPTHLSDAFASDLDEYFQDSDVSLWVHGHTHTNIEYKMGKVPVITNQFGYLGYEECPKTFVPDKFKEI